MIGDTHEYNRYRDTADCEVEDCPNPRGDRLGQLATYGCVLCTHHENQLQLGNISLPESATEARKRRAEDQILG